MFREEFSFYAREFTHFLDAENNQYRQSLTFTTSLIIH